MAYHVRVTRQAQGDITSIYEYLYRESPRTAETWVRLVAQAIQELSQFPRQHPQRCDSSTPLRELRSARVWNYHIIFGIRGNQCEVFTIRHAARQSPNASDLTGE